MPKDYSKGPRNLPLFDVTKEMYAVKKRMDIKLTDNITKIKQLKIVHMLNKLIKEAQLTPQKKKDDKKKGGGKKKNQKKDQKKMQDPQNSEKKKSGEKKPGGQKPGQKKPSTKKSSKPGKAKHPGGVPMPNELTKVDIAKLLKELRWTSLQDIDVEDTFRNRESEVIMRTYSPLIRAYIRILSEIDPDRQNADTRNDNN